MSLVRCISKPYVYTFYVLVKFFIDEWRACLVMCVFQFLIVAGLVCGVAFATGHTPLLISKTNIVLVALIIYALTQYFLVRGHRWKQYKSEFDQYSKLKSRVASIAVWSSIVLGGFGAISLIKTVVR